MNELDILYKILDFEVCWNKFHLIKQKSYIFRVEYLNDVFDKLEISDINLINSIDQLATTKPKTGYNFIKSGEFLKHIPPSHFEGVSYRFKSIIQNSDLKIKYPHFKDIEFDYQYIFAKCFSLRCAIYRLEHRFDMIDIQESLELDVEKLVYQKLLSNIKKEIQDLDKILSQLINPYNKSIIEEDILHATIDFSQLV